MVPLAISLVIGMLYLVFVLIVLLIKGAVVTLASLVNAAAATSDPNFKGSLGMVWIGVFGMILSFPLLYLALITPSLLLGLVAIIAFFVSLVIYSISQDT